jgi:hypothetical protein
VAKIAFGLGLFEGKGDGICLFLSMNGLCPAKRELAEAPFPTHLNHSSKHALSGKHAKSDPFKNFRLLLVAD